MFLHFIYQFLMASLLSFFPNLNPELLLKFQILQLLIIDLIAHLLPSLADDVSLRLGLLWSTVSALALFYILQG